MQLIDAYTICAGALQLVLEELLMGDVHMHPFEVLGWEGIIGTAFMLATLALATVVPGDASALSSPWLFC